MKRLTSVVVASLVAGSLLVGCEDVEVSDIQDTNPTKVEQGTEEVLVDSELVTISYVGVGENTFGKVAKLTIYNHSDQPIKVRATDTSVDGVMEQLIVSEDIQPGKLAKVDGYFIEDMGNYQQVEGKFTVHNLDDAYGKELSSYNFEITVD